MSERAPMDNTELVRFSRGRRIEHLAVMVLFTLLVLTGLPQKFFEAGWAHAVVSAFGGLSRLRWVHRACGLAFAGLTITHVSLAIAMIAGGRKNALALVPTRKDFADAVHQLRYYLGTRDEPAEFDRYDYRQKFEYLGMLFGGVIMTVTGFILFFPTATAALLTGEAIPAAKVAHGSEGLLAFLVIITWHIYNAHLNPDVFPFDKTIFTGKITRARMHHEHPLELARIDAAAPSGAAGGAAAAPAEREPR